MASLRGRGGRLSPIYQLIANFVLVIAGLPWPETDSNLSGADLAPSSTQYLTLPGLKAQVFLRLHSLNILIARASWAAPLNPQGRGDIS